MIFHIISHHQFNNYFRFLRIYSDILSHYSHLTYFYNMIIIHSSFNTTLSLFSHPDSFSHDTNFVFFHSLPDQFFLYHQHLLKIYSQSFTLDLSYSYHVSILLVLYYHRGRKILIVITRTTSNNICIYKSLALL